MSLSPVSRPLVLNAASEKQTEKADKILAKRQQRELDDIRFMLTSEAGRRFLWRMLTHCRVFESIYEQNARIHYNSGVQDVGHFILGEITKARPEALIEMMREQNRNQMEEQDDG